MKRWSETERIGSKMTRQPPKNLQEESSSFMHRFRKSNVESEGEVNLTADSIYTFYTEHLIPAVLSSLPILAHRITDDSLTWSKSAVGMIANFLLPQWSQDHASGALPSLREIWWEKAINENIHNSDRESANTNSNLSGSDPSSSPSPSIAEFLLERFDANGDGHISATELLNMTEFMNRYWPVHPRHHGSWISSLWMWFSKEWPLFEWKVGVFLWRTFGGIILLLAFLSIVPGRMHGLAGRILRWPLLALTYFFVGVELMVYTVIRLFIRLAEHLVARPRHRKLRRRMASSVTYEEWHGYASTLDKSQGRERWLSHLSDDQTSTRYNWGFIRQLIKDIRLARSKGDSLQALAVLQQCTRKNVGGIMSEDLFAYANTGEPKAIVREFIDEVVTTMHWITEEARELPEKRNSAPFLLSEKSKYAERLHEKVKSEKSKLWSVFVATASFLDQSGDFEDGHSSISPSDDGEDFDDSSNHKIKNITTISPCTTEINASSNHSRDNSAASVASSSLPACHREELINFFKRARTAYGRTALCLSGGAMMGAYHFGHILGMLENGILPNIISGTSAGSVIAAILCTRTEEEIIRDLRPDVVVDRLTCFSRPWSERFKSVMENGCMFDLEEWLRLIRWFTCGDLTFEEAYQKTGRVFCITLSSTTKKAPPVLLNYLSAPNVVLASAVVASAGVPGFVKPVKLQYKGANGVISEHGGDWNETYYDGSIETDIPVDALSELFNCQFFIACQCNPHIVPFFFNCKGGVGRPSRWSSGTQEESWRGGYLLASLEMYLKNHMRAKHRFLNEVEAAVGFTTTMFTQEYVGSTTIVPQVRFADYFKLFSNPGLEDLYWYFQAGAVAVYEHTAMIKLHFSIADALDKCIAKLEPTRVQAPNQRLKLTIPEAKKVTVQRGSKTCHPVPSNEERSEPKPENYENNWIRLE